MYLSSINVGLFNNFNDVILLLPSSTIYLLLSSLGVTMIKSTGLRPLVTISSTREYKYLQPIITQYFIGNKSEIWSLSLIVHSKG